MAHTCFIKHYIYIIYIYIYHRTVFKNLSTFESFLKSLSTFKPSPNFSAYSSLPHIYIYIYTYLYPCVAAACDLWRSYATWQRVVRGYSTVSIIAGLPLLECVHVWHMPGTSCIMHLSESCTHHAYIMFDHAHTDIMRVPSGARCTRRNTKPRCITSRITWLFHV